MVLKFNTGRIPTIRHSKILSDREIFLTQAKLSKVLRERHTTGKKWYREGVQGEKRSGAAPVLRDKGGARSAPPSLLAGTKNNSLKNEIPGPRKYFDDFARNPPAPLSFLWDLLETRMEMKKKTAKVNAIFMHLRLAMRGELIF